MNEQVFLCASVSFKMFIITFECSLIITKCMVTVFCEVIVHCGGAVNVQIMFCYKLEGF